MFQGYSSYLIYYIKKIPSFFCKKNKDLLNNDSLSNKNILKENLSNDSMLNESSEPYEDRLETFSDFISLERKILETVILLLYF